MTGASLEPPPEDDEGDDEDDEEEQAASPPPVVAAKANASTIREAVRRMLAAFVARFIVNHFTAYRH